MNNKFNYRYSAPTEEERKEIASIRKQYSPTHNGETKLEKLRRLDGLVKNTAIIWSLVLGVVGCLIFGLGLAMVLEWKIIFWGVVVAVVGAIPMALAYPVYLGLLNRGKERHGEEILKLSEELLNEND